MFQVSHPRPAPPAALPGQESLTGSVGCPEMKRPVPRKPGRRNPSTQSPRTIGVRAHATAAAYGRFVYIGRAMIFAPDAVQV